MSSKDKNEKSKEEKENEKLKEEKENKKQNEKLNENENENENESENDYENEDEYETMSQNKKKIIKELNDHLDEVIDKSKSFEDQIKLFKKLEGLKGYWPYNNYELKCKYFKVELADMSNEIDKKLFEQIFGHTLIKLADKLINTTNKEENQIIVKNIEKNKDKLFKEDEFYNFLIQPQKCSDLKYTIDLILDSNETIQLDLV